MHDLVVLGGGPGGYATAFRAAARGLDVALVEADKVGGTCLHRGCIPSKAILHVAGVLAEVRRAGDLGLQLAYQGLDGAALDRFRHRIIQRLHRGLEGLVAERVSAYHVGRGRLLDPGVVEVTTASGARERVQGREVVLATGSRPRHLPGVAVDRELVLTSDEALWFLEAPARAVIVGAGAVGMEFASMWAPMGTHITVLEALDRPLPAEDPDSSAAIARAFADQGIEILTGAQIEQAHADHDTEEVALTVTAAGEPRRLTADVVLVAVGRSPSTAELGLDDLGVLDDAGCVATDAHGRTGVEGLWAVGDLRPGPALAHAAFAEGFAAADALAGLDHAPPVDHTHTPQVTFCHPEVASVGLTEPDARARYDDVTTTTYDLTANARGLMAGQPGHAKVVHRAGHTPAWPTGQPGGPVLGVHVVGPHATDLIAEAALATTWEALPAELAAITHPHPTLAELLGEAFLAAAGTPFHTR